jgi:hypothetical protein
MKPAFPGRGQTSHWRHNHPTQRPPIRSGLFLCIYSWIALARFGHDMFSLADPIADFPLRHTLASQGCCSQGKPAGR